jgi:hypothetical protein
MVAAAMTVITIKKTLTDEEETIYWEGVKQGKTDAATTIDVYHQHQSAHIARRTTRRLTDKAYNQGFLDGITAALAKLR